MTAADSALRTRAATLAVRQIGLRTWRVASASRPGVEYIVKGAAGEPFESLCCNCEGGRGRCGHKTAVALRLNIPVPDAATRRRPATDKLTSSSLQAPGGRPDPAARPAGEIDHTTGDAMPPKADGELMTFRCTVPPIMSAVKVDGGPDGGVRLQIDVPGADEAAALAFVKACRGRELRLVVVDESKGA